MEPRRRKGNPPPVPQQPLESSQAWLRRAMGTDPHKDTKQELTARLVQLVLVALVGLLAAPALTQAAPGQAFAVATDSMEPAITQGSLVLVQEETPRIGDIVAYEASTGGVQIHRLVSVTQQDGSEYYVTKGDANPGEDAYLVSPDQVVGTVQADVPAVGYAWTLPRGHAPAMFLGLVAVYLGIAAWDARRLLESKLPGGSTLLVLAAALVLVVPPVSGGIATVFAGSSSTAAVAAPSPLFLDEGDAGSASISDTNSSATATASAPSLDTRSTADHVLGTQVPAACGFSVSVETDAKQNLGRLNGLDVSLRVGGSTPDVPATMPTAKSAASAVRTDDTVFIFGGWDGTSARTEILRYDPDAGSVDLMTSTVNAPTGRQGMSAVWTGTYVYLFGGTGTDVFGGGATAEILRYDPANDTITTMTETLPTPRYSTTAVWDGTHAYVFGGFDDATVYDDVLQYDPATDTITDVATLPGRRTGASAVWNGTHALVFGGHDGDNPRATILTFQPPSGTPSTLSATLPTPRLQTSAEWTGNEAFIYGGEESFGGTPVAQVVRFVPSSGVVTVQEAALPTARRATAAAGNATQIHLIGGQDAGGGYLTDIVRHNATRSTLGMEHVSLPSATSRASAVWTGTHAFVFGGYDGAPKDSIVRIDPAAETVTTMDATLPFPRRGTSAVWNGTHAFIFGGYNGSEATDDIVRYDPSTGSATTLSGSSLPRPLYLTSAVWTGTHVYIFGGVDGSLTIYDKIYRFDPSDGAVTTVTDSLPRGLAATGAAWNGTHAFIFGGIDETGTLRSEILKFDPATETDSTMTDTLPTARFRISAVFDGTHAFVFGGDDGGTDASAGLLDDVVRFDPGADSSTLRSGTLPTARRATAAVWTGGQVLVAGGEESGPTSLTDIVTYDPAADATSTMVRLIDRTMSLTVPAGGTLEHTMSVNAASTGTSTIDTHLVGSCQTAGVETRQAITYEFS